MQTRETFGGTDAGTGPATEPDDAIGALAGMGQTALLVCAALIGSAVLIAFLAALSMCWEVHPLLTVVAGAVLLWGARRLSRLLLTTSRRTAD